MTRWWIELARGWLKLPAGDPVLPGDPQRRISWNPGQGYLRYALVGLAASSVVSVPFALLLIAAGVTSLVAPAGDAGRSAGAVTGFVLTGGGGAILLSMALRYAVIRLELDMLRYTLTDQALRLRRGVVEVEEVTLSYVNVQNVRFVQGPLQRYFGIADLLVETAGGGASTAAQPHAQQQVASHRGLIKGVSEPEKLRDLILDRVREAKGSGLGDSHEDHEDERPAAAETSLASPEALALLRAIRDELAAARRAAGAS